MNALELKPGHFCQLHRSHGEPWIRAESRANLQCSRSFAPGSCGNAQAAAARADERSPRPGIASFAVLPNSNGDIS